MPWSHKQPSTGDESVPPVYDDGGSGLLDACEARFSASGWEIRCDSNHSVWIEDPDTAYSVGIAQWMTERRSLATILDYVEAKMHKAEVRTHG